MDLDEHHAITLRISHKAAFNLGSSHLITFDTQLKTALLYLE